MGSDTKHMHLTIEFAILNSMVYGTPKQLQLK